MLRFWTIRQCVVEPALRIEIVLQCWLLPETIPILLLLSETVLFARERKLLVLQHGDSEGVGWTLYTAADGVLDKQALKTSQQVRISNCSGNWTYEVTVGNAPVWIRGGRLYDIARPRDGRLEQDASVGKGATSSNLVSSVTSDTDPLRVAIELLALL